jgi:hypothetical protein
MLTHGCSLFNFYVELDLNADGNLSLEEFRVCLKKMSFLAYSEKDSVRMYQSFTKGRSRGQDMLLDEFYFIMRPLILRDYEGYPLIK